jgi:hypothetical protein
MSATTSAVKTSATSSADADKYIIFGINFKEFLGMDLSGLIDTFGGAFNFQISSCLSCLLCIFSIFILIFFVSKGGDKKGGKGLKIPGIGTLGPQQPLVIQMPMQTKPYPFHDSVFPRDT